MCFLNTFLHHEPVPKVLKQVVNLSCLACCKKNDTVFEEVYGFLAEVLVAMVFEAVLEAARKKPDAVPYQNRSALQIGCIFFFDRFNAP